MNSKSNDLIIDGMCHFGDIKGICNGGLFLFLVIEMIVSVFDL